MTQGQLGALLGPDQAVKQAVVSGWERGEFRPSLKRLEALHRVLGVSVAWLLGETKTRRRRRRR